MPLTHQQKQAIIDGLKEKIEKQKAMVFVDFAGTKVKDISKLRSELREEDCEFKVAKKTLLKIAFQKEGLDFPQKIEGEVGVGFGFNDEISPFRILNEFSKELKGLKILGGIVGKELIDGEKAAFLAVLPCKNELLAKMVGGISAPLSGLAGVLRGNMRNLICLLGAIKK